MRKTVTDWLEVVGCVLLAVGGAVEVARFTLAGGIAAGGLLLIGVSALLTLTGRDPAPRRGDESA